MYTVHAELISITCEYALKVIGHKVETSNPTGFLEKQIRIYLTLEQQLMQHLEIATLRSTSHPKTQL